MSAITTGGEILEVQGARIPRLGFGTWRLFGRSCERAVTHALELGYRHLDTASMYQNEYYVGRGLRAALVQREEVFLVTKVPRRLLGPRRLQLTVELSLKLLRVDYVDLLLIHWPRRRPPMERSLEVMLRLVEQGKVRRVGVSNFTPSQVDRARRSAPILCNQVEYHPHLSQRALLEQARRHDMALVAYCPLARGRVLGDPVIADIARRHGKLPSQVVLRWLLQQPGVVAIPKAASPEHRRANWQVWDFQLSDEDMRRIHACDRGARLIDPSFVKDWER